jgi:hypothetical protein
LGVGARLSSSSVVGAGSDWGDGKMFLFFPALAAAAAEPAPQRIEKFSQDHTPAEIAAAHIDRTRALAREAYLWGCRPFCITARLRKSSRAAG